MPRPVRVHALIDTLALGGAQALLAQLAPVARGAGIELSVGYLKEHRGSPVAARLRAGGVEPRLVGIPGRLGPGAVAAVRRQLAAIRPEVVHTHLAYSDILGTLASRSLGLPVVSTLHGAVPEAGRAAAGRRRLAAVLRRRLATRVIAVCDHVRAEYLAAALDRPDHVVTIRNGVGAAPAAAEAGRALRRELGIDLDAPVVTMLGALRPEKGHDLALAALPQLRSRVPDAVLLVAGDGRLREPLERGAAAHGRAVVLAGYRDDPGAVLAATDVLLQPSRHDALPTSVIEAMAAGVPVVATPVGGLPELVEDGVTGVVTAASGIADALASLLADPAGRAAMGAAGRARYERELTAERWAASLAELYREVAR